MASVSVAAVARKAEDWPLANPWTWMLAAFLTTGLAAGLARSPWGEATEGLRLALIVLGLLVLGIALWVGFGSAHGLSRPLAWRLETVIAGFLAAGALLLGAWLGYSLLLKLTEFARGYVLPDTRWNAPVAATWTMAEGFFHFVLFLFAVLLTAVFGSAAYRHTGWTVRDRSAALLGCAVVVAMLAEWGLDTGADEWASLRLFLGIASMVAFVAAGVVWLPQTWRRAWVSAFVVLHLCGIGTAALAAPPTPWAINEIWARFYRPYLEFMYLNNAYRYYSPEPGPPSLLWFRVEYTEGEGPQAKTHYRWIYVPDMDTETGRHRHPLGLIYQRRLSLTQNTMVAEKAPELVVRTPDGGVSVNPVYERRLQHAPQDLAGPIPLGAVRPPPTPGKLIVPFHPTIRQEQQIQPPSAYARHLFSSYARYALSLPHPKFPDAVPKSVKIYRVIHDILPPVAYAAGMHPTDMVLFEPYYEGEYDLQGNLTPAAQKDAFLYWMIPSLRDDATDMEHSKIRCFYLRHAGDTDWVLYPDKTWHAE